MVALLIGMARRNLIELRRYGFDTFVQLLGITVLFLLLFWGAEGIGGDRVAENDTLPSIVAGFIVFSLVLVTFFQVVTWVTNESLLGTLEQLALSPFGLYRVFVAEFVSGLGINVVVLSVLSVATMALTGQWLSFDVVTLVPLVGLVILGVLGLSFALAGFALVFKRVQSLLNVTQGLLLALIALPLEDTPWLRFAPVSLPNALIRESTVRGVGLADMAAGDLALSVATAALSFACGSVVFQRFERVARDRDLVGAY